MFPKPFFDRVLHALAAGLRHCQPGIDGSGESRCIARMFGVEVVRRIARTGKEESRCYTARRELRFQDFNIDGRPLRVDFAYWVPIAFGFVIDVSNMSVLAHVDLIGGQRFPFRCVHQRL